MASATVPTFVDALARNQLLEPTQLDEVVRSLQPRCADSQALANELIKRRWLTPFQAEQLLQGRGQQLILGHYVLLDSLGEGGMGQIYRARHRRLDRVVALKTIRPDRLSSPDAVRRFEREARAAARLSHPNIVLVHDADEINGIHFIAMEMVEGIDLDRLVTEHGRLPVDRACLYIKQAALGLQHAHERNLVHRDIKPANLLVSYTDGQVKLLDLGLARLDTGQISGSLTQEGMVMGTLDYLAPEQAMDSHKADIRADIYSLGCSLYFLLAGRPPFPGGTVTQKLIWHQQAEPPAVTEIRPEVPPELEAILAMMLAKRPADRYQTPSEVVDALEPFSADSASAPQHVTASTPRPPRASPSTVTRPPSGTVTGRPRSASDLRRRSSEPLAAPRERSWFLTHGLGLLSCGLTALSGGALFLTLAIGVAHRGSSGESDNSSFFAFIGLLMIAAWGGAAFGGLLGVIAVFIPGNNKLLSFGGAGLGALIFLGMLTLLCMGWFMA